MDINYIRLCQIKKEIVNLTKEAEEIIKREFPDQYSISISFWIPQLITSLEKSEKWLPRGDYPMEDILDKIKSNIEND
jgi:hypothetical protein